MAMEKRMHKRHFRTEIPEQQYCHRGCCRLLSDEVKQNKITKNKNPRNSKQLMNKRLEFFFHFNFNLKWSSIAAFFLFFCSSIQVSAYLVNSFDCWQ